MFKNRRHETPTRKTFDTLEDTNTTNANLCERTAFYIYKDTKAKFTASMYLKNKYRYNTAKTSS